MSARRWAWGLLVALALSPARGLAQGQAHEADGLITKGIELRQQGKDDEALEAFRRADALESTPRSRAQMALAEQALGIWVAAEAHLLSSLSHPDDAWIARNRAALDGALETIKRHLGNLEVRGGVPGAEVYVDGARIGTLPMTGAWRVEAGSRSIEVRAPGHHGTARATQIPAGGTARETIELTAEAAAPPRSEGAAPSPSPSPPAVTGGSTQRTLGWGLVGLGGALAATGTAGLLVWQGAISSYNEDGSCPGLGNAQQPPGCQDKVSRADTWQTVSILGFVGGGLSAIAGIVLVLSAPSKAPPAVACGPSASAFGCTLNARF